jgi:superfamily II RNA helicase
VPTLIIPQVHPLEMSAFLNICDLSKEPSHKVSEYAIQYPYKLDIFQEYAISAIDQQHNVLVCAKTGSGKTLVAEYAIAHCLKQGKRVFYTTPIKSLSNQKFHDLKQMWPEPGMVGIMTGDIKFCPDAKIIVMTTEILRNLLYKRGSSTEHVGITASLNIQDLGAVVFDECHYINDRDRGKVWEETMILLPREIQLIMLSATLDRPEFFAEWIGELKQTPCHLIQTQHRVVPLTHSILRGQNLYTIMDSKEVFQDGVCADWLRTRATTEKEHEAYQRKVAAAKAGGHEGAVSGKVRVESFNHQLNRCVDMLHSQGLLPALAFVLSRKGCEQHAVRTESQLLDSSDSRTAEHIFDFHLRHHKDNLETIGQYHALKKLVAKGIAFHHSGVLPVLKEVIEILFTKGYIKLLYCTETFAVGINMPTKTVIFTGLSKYDDTTGGMRLLRTDEYIQMAGRAGRRGKDKFGQVIFLPERDPPTVFEMKMILKGGRPEIQSRMDFHYDFLLKCFQAKETKWLDIQQKSYWYRQQQTVLETYKRDASALKKSIQEIQIPADAMEELAEKQRLETLVATLSNAKRRQAQQKLDAWLDDHEGPNWKIYETQMKKRGVLEMELKQVEDQIASFVGNTGNVDRWISILKKAAYLDDDCKLTPKGVLATEFNEGHSLLCTEFFGRNLHKDLTGEELVSTLACFMEEKDKDDGPTLQDLIVPKTVKSALDSIGRIAEDCMGLEDAEGLHSPTGYWGLSLTWVDPIWRWIQGDSAAAICMDYGLFEGNFVRAVLRVANMVDEWTSVATLAQDLETLEKLQDVKQKLIREILVPDSLYLHL